MKKRNEKPVVKPLTIQSELERAAEVLGPDAIQQSIDRLKGIQWPSEWELSEGFPKVDD
jgi:hypothetical protein